MLVAKGVRGASGYDVSVVCSFPLSLIHILICISSSDVTAIIFVVASSSYDMVIREDGKTVSCT